MTDLQKAREIFGDELRDTHEYVGWINGLSSFEFRKANINSCEDTWKLLTRAHKFNSQPFKREWIERPHPINGYAEGSYQNKCGECEEFFMGDKRAVRCYKCSGYDSWKSLFKGEWKIDQFITCNGDYTGMWYDSEGVLRDECNTETTTLNDFLTKCKEQGIRVLLNDPQ